MKDEKATGNSSGTADIARVRQTEAGGEVPVVVEVYGQDDDKSGRRLKTANRRTNRLM